MSDCLKNNSFFEKSDLLRPVACDNLFAWPAQVAGVSEPLEWLALCTQSNCGLVNQHLCNSMTSCLHMHLTLTFRITFLSPAFGLQSCMKDLLASSAASCLNDQIQQTPGVHAQWLRWPSLFGVLHHFWEAVIAASFFKKFVFLNRKSLLLRAFSWHVHFHSKHKILRKGYLHYLEPGFFLLGPNFCCS